MANVRFYNDLRLKEKAANERMRQLEKADLKSPAYLAVQAKLEILGKQTKGDRGRRFSETGKATYNEMETLNKILDEFLYDYQTSTLKGARQYERDVWESANTNNQLTDAGISRDDWLEFWKNMPDRKDRLYESEHYVSMMRAYTIKYGQLEDDNKMTMAEIAEEVEASKNLKDAYKRIGVTYKEVDAAKPNKKPLKKND